MTDTPALLEARGLAKSYGPVQALRSADLVVVPGEVHALLGANGAGKSTLVKLLTGVTDADRGEIRVRGKDVRVGGGVSTVREYLRAGLIDEMHLVISPVLLGSGENLLAGIDLPALGFRPTEQVTSEKALHVVLTRAST